MKQYTNEFFNYLSGEREYSENTIVGYKKDINQFIEEIKIKSPSDISKSTIRAFLSKLKNEMVLRNGKKGLTPKSRNRKLSAIKLFCKFLKEEGHIKVNPSLEIDYARVEKRLPVYFSENEISDVIESAEDHYRDQAILEIFYSSGPRVSEVVGIKVEDVDFHGKTLRLFGKGGKERIVPATTNSLKAIATHLQAREKDSEYLFACPYKDSTKPISARTARNVVYKYGKKKNNLPKISPHKIRHSVATHLHKNGMDIRNVQELLGHEDISTTMMYTHIVNEALTKSFQSSHPRG